MATGPINHTESQTMISDPLAGRHFGAPEQCRMLIATADGVFLWPGSALLERRGNGFVAMMPRDVNARLGCFFGPAANDTSIHSLLEFARDELCAGRKESVQRRLDCLPLPPLSSNGQRLMQAVAARQGLTPPDIPASAGLSGTAWSDSDIEIFARLFDGIHSRAHLLEKAFNPNAAWDPAKHPRWPAGQSDGGQFRPDDGDYGGGQSLILPAAAKKPPEFLPHSPPKIPVEPPASLAARNVVRREVAWWLWRATMAGEEVLDPVATLAFEAVTEGVEWLYPYVKAYLDSPKSLEDLQTAARNPQRGYDVHHIVEQTSAEKDGFPRSQIDDPDNLAAIPTLRHWELNSWYETPSADYAGLAPRQYVKGKDWEMRREIGLRGLRAVGVLK